MCKAPDWIQDRSPKGENPICTGAPSESFPIFVVAKPTKVKDHAPEVGPATSLEKCSCTTFPHVRWNAKLIAHDAPCFLARAATGMTPFERQSLLAVTVSTRLVLRHAAAGTLAVVLALNHLPIVLGLLLVIGECSSRCDGLALERSFVDGDALTDFLVRKRLLMLFDHLFIFN